MPSPQKPPCPQGGNTSNLLNILKAGLLEKSDGKVVVVDNKYLKAKNPLLLINFYERHLKYNAT